MDEPHQSDCRLGLLCLEQWPKPIVLWVQFLQGWFVGEPEEGMEESQCDFDSGSGGADMGLPHCMQCIQECSDRGSLPQIQAGLGLVLCPSTPHFSSRWFWFVFFLIFFCWMWLFHWCTYNIFLRNVLSRLYGQEMRIRLWDLITCLPSVKMGIKFQLVAFHKYKILLFQWSQRFHKVLVS